jgi:hypothetical protein
MPYHLSRVGSTEGGADQWWCLKSKYGDDFDSIQTESVIIFVSVLLNQITTNW